MKNLYDVIAVDLKTNRVRLISEKITLRNAEAIVSMAVMRRGVGEEFFAQVEAGAYKEGDTWKGQSMVKS